MEPTSHIEFQIGELKGQVSSLIQTVGELTRTIASMDSRLRENEKDTTMLIVKMGGVSLIGGGVASYFLHYLVH